MAYPFILYTNIYESGTVTATSEATGFDVENIFDWRSYVRWKATSTATQYITVDYGTAVSCDALGITGHNLSDATVSVESSTTGAWAGEQATRLSGFTPTDNADICKPFTAASVRYWRIKILTPTTAPEIGVLCLGARLDFPKNPTRPLLFNNEGMEVVSERSKGGHILGVVNYFRPYSIALSFSWLTIAFLRGDLYTFWSTHGGLHKPFFLQVNSDQWDVGRFVQLPERYRYNESFDDYIYSNQFTIDFEGIL